MVVLIIFSRFSTNRTDKQHLEVFAIGLNSTFHFAFFYRSYRFSRHGSWTCSRYTWTLSLCLSLFLSATQFCSVECETVAVQGSNTTGSFICNFHSKLCQGRTQHCHIKYPLSNLYFGNMQYCNWLQQVCAVFEKCVKNTAQAGVSYICPLISNDHFIFPAPLYLLWVSSHLWWLCWTLERSSLPHKTCSECLGVVSWLTNVMNLIWTCALSLDGSFSYWCSRNILDIKGSLTLRSV